MNVGKRFRRAAIAVGATMALGGGLFTGLAPNVSLASSHREAPLVAADPQVDATDLYAFRSPDKQDTLKKPEKPGDESAMERLEPLTKALLKVPKDAIQEPKKDKPQPQS